MLGTLFCKMSGPSYKSINVYLLIHHCFLIDYKPLQAGPHVFCLNSYFFYYVMSNFSCYCTIWFCSILSKSAGLPNILLIRMGTSRLLFRLTLAESVDNLVTGCSDYPQWQLSGNRELVCYISACPILLFCKDKCDWMCLPVPWLRCPIEINMRICLSWACRLMGRSGDIVVGRMVVHQQLSYVP